MSLGSCSICGEEILEKDLRDVHDQWVGWHLRRGRGGAGGPNTKGKYARKTGAVAHGRCVEEAHSKQQRGIAVQQKGLF